MLWCCITEIVRLPVEQLLFQSFWMHSTFPGGSSKIIMLLSHNWCWLTTENSTSNSLKYDNTLKADLGVGIQSHITFLLCLSLMPQEGI